MDGAEALHRVNAAKEEIRRREQERCGQVPPTPVAVGTPTCADAIPEKRKYEMVLVEFLYLRDDSQP